MIIPKTDFKNAIDVVSPFARAKSTLQILTNIKIESTGERITFTASHVDSQIEHWIDCKGEKFACCIEAAALKKFASFCQGDVAFTVKGTKATLECGDLKTKLSTLQAEEFPILQRSENVITELEWGSIGAKIHFSTQFCADKHPTPQCTCVNITSTGTKIDILATDQKSASLETLAHIAPEFGICIPVETARHMIGPFRSLVVREEQLELRGPNSIALFKTAPCKPLSLAKLFDLKLPNAGEVDRKALLDAIQFVSSFSDQGKIRGMVKVAAGESNVVRLAGAGNEAAAPFDYRGDSFEFAGYHDDWAQFLKALEGDKVKFQFDQGDMLRTQLRLTDAGRMILTLPLLV